MNLALVGQHPDGLQMASALVETGRHQLLVSTLPLPESWRSRSNVNTRIVSDLEEVLADPAVEAVLVAGTLANRAAQLRRALQSERHVLCVHPADLTPDTAYEASLLQADARCALLPLLTDSLHPGTQRLAQLRAELGPLQLVEVEHEAPGSVLLESGTDSTRAALPGWDVLRRLGGEIAEVSCLATKETLDAAEPLLLAGRFEQGGLIQMRLLPGRREPRWHVGLVCRDGEANLLFPLGRPGPAFLRWRGADGLWHEEAWDICDPWPALVEAWEAAVSARAGPRAAMSPPLLTWQDAVRCLELDDAVRRSAERGRASVLEYPQASEEAGFKGTMTLVGCAVLWLSLLLVILSVWLPALGWVIGPALVVFLLLQLFLWVARRG